MSAAFARIAPAPAPAAEDLAVGGSWLYELITAVYGRLIALTAIVVLAPLWFVIAITIKLTSPGPVLFRTPIIGRGGRPFVYNKFRTMRIGGDDAGHRRWVRAWVYADRPYAHDDDGRPVFKLTNDPRVTRVGRWLRRASLDEMPQLINVLRGDMNIVGPRPPVVYEYGLYGPQARGRVAVKPGITGLYQVRRRGRATFSEMLELDLDYVRRRSLWLDLCIIARTPLAILRGEVTAS
ncbi:MAG: sugar transferase [Dehalococcoidia bacterium]|nr:MAG: sugar transferase [Dehalococcoidia bacterium]